MSAEEILDRTEELFRAQQSQDLRDLVATKAEGLRGYDVERMDRVVAIEAWGRSGSVLLASYLDGHDDVVMLPALRSDGIYKFFALYPSLSLRQKLMGYAVFTEYYDAQSQAAGCGRSIFDGVFAISPEQYYAAVQAIALKYEDFQSEFIGSRRAFFVLVHVAYSLAVARRPTGSRPLMVCAQHEWDDTRAQLFVEDFPAAKFVHTVRDPITSFDRLFDWFFDPELLPDRQAANATQSARYVSLLAPWSVIRVMVKSDKAHTGMESRTRAIRFEDMHSNTAATMIDLSAWLGLRYQPTLVESSFNGIPYVVTRDGKTWSGASREKVERQARNISPKDRALLFAMFIDDFRAWKYPYPKLFEYSIVRVLVLCTVIFLPMKMEFVVAKAAWKRRVWPWLRRGKLAVPLDAVLRVGFCRLAILGLVAREAPRRLFHRKKPLQLNRSEGACSGAAVG